MGCSVLLSQMLAMKKIIAIFRWEKLLKTQILAYCGLLSDIHVSLVGRQS